MEENNMHNELSFAPEKCLGDVMLTLRGERRLAHVMADGHAVLDTGMELTLDEAQFALAQSILAVAREEDALSKKAKAPGQEEVMDGNVPDSTPAQSADSDISHLAKKEKKDVKREKRGIGRGLCFVLGLVVGCLAGAGILFLTHGAILFGA